MHKRERLLVVEQGGKVLPAEQARFTMKTTFLQLSSSTTSMGLITTSMGFSTTNWYWSWSPVLTQKLQDFALA